MKVKGFREEDKGEKERYRRMKGRGVNTVGSVGESFSLSHFTEICWGRNAYSAWGGDRRPLFQTPVAQNVLMCR